MRAKHSFGPTFTRSLQSPHRDQPAPCGCSSAPDSPQQLDESVFVISQMSVSLVTCQDKGQMTKLFQSALWGKHQFAIGSQLTASPSTSLHLTETTPLDPQQFRRYHQLITVFYLAAERTLSV